MASTPQSRGASQPPQTPHKRAEMGRFRGVPIRDVDLYRSTSRRSRCEREGPSQADSLGSHSSGAYLLSFNQEKQITDHATFLVRRHDVDYRPPHRLEGHTPRRHTPAVERMSVHRRARSALHDVCFAILLYPREKSGIAREL
jgi:hypothetical protein